MYSNDKYNAEEFFMLFNKEADKSLSHSAVHSILTQATMCSVSAHLSTLSPLLCVLRSDPQHELICAWLLLLPPELLPSTQPGAYGPRGSTAEPGETGPTT